MSSFGSGFPRATRAPERATTLAPLEGARLFEDEPWVEVLALPLALVFAWAFCAFSFGRLLATLVQIQFHELGHATCAWFSSRAALPLPFGFTFVSAQQSGFVTVCMLFLIGLFTHRALREQRASAAFGGVSALVLLATLTFLVPSERSQVLVGFGGFMGELALSALSLVLFYVRLPDRLRWDFFRFLALPPSAAAWLLAQRTWRRIAAGEHALPTRSFLPGDGGGDFERLLAHGFSTREIVASAMLVANVSVVALALLYAWRAERAIRALRAR